MSEWRIGSPKKLLHTTARSLFTRKPNLAHGLKIMKTYKVLFLPLITFFFIAQAVHAETPAMPENPPETWLTYHLAHPVPELALDPNPAFFWKGRYHLHYIYRNLTGYVFAHVSSDDMVHWEWHPTVLGPTTTGHGMFSGTGFITKDGRPAMVYHGKGSNRNWISYALDDNLDQWTKPRNDAP